MHCRIMGKNEKMTVIITFPQFFARFLIGFGGKLLFDLLSTYFH